MFCGIAYADDVTLNWAGVDKAVGYKIYISGNLGETWGNGIDVGNVNVYVYKDVPTDGLYLFRVSAYSDKGEAIRTEYGAWYNAEWIPKKSPSKVGIGDQ